MKTMHHRSVIVALLVVFVVSVIVGTLLPPRVMAEVTGVLTGKGTAAPDDRKGGCQICEWIWVDWPFTRKLECHYYYPCITE